LSDDLNIETQPAETPPAETQPSPDERIAALEAQARELADQNRRLAEQLSRPAAAPTPAQPQAAPRLSPSQQDVVTQLASQTGLAPEDVQYHLRVLGPMFEHLAAPAIQAILGLDDRLDQVGVKLKVPQESWTPEFEARVEQERQARISRGQFVRRDEIAAMLLAQDQANPAAIEKRVQAMVEQKLAAMQGASAQGAVIPGGAGSQSQPAGPQSGKERGALPPADQFAALPLSEQEALLDKHGMTF